MDVEIRATAAGQFSEQDLRSLREWLLTESRRPGSISYLEQRGEPGTMGAVSDVLQVSLGAGGAATVLAASVSVWLRTRSREVALTLRRADGECIEIKGHVKRPDETIRAFLEVATES